jgi:N-acyl-D-aspartate/D-glutamate deacylase
MRTERLRDSAAFAFCILIAVVGAACAPVARRAAVPDPSAREYDIVVTGGRVIDPDSGRDAAANVGVLDGRIASISTRPLMGRRQIDATGLVVAPGFIDILAAPSREFQGQTFKVMDGVTTVVGMHGGPVDITKWYDERVAAGSLHHYGTTIGHASLREAVGVTDRYAAATDAQAEQMVRLAEKGIESGAIGIGFGLEYVPGASRLETFELFKTAARFDVPCHLHIRFSDPDPPGTNFEALEEVIAAAAISGASAQIVHINSTGGTWTMQKSLEFLSGARLRGLDIMADVYPYTAWSTGLSSARFDPGFRENFRIDYGDIELVSTGERLTEESFKKYRDQGDVSVIAHAMPEADIVMALRHPLVMVGSDGIIQDGRGHPRGAGTFARVLGRYVREQRQVSLIEALRKMTIMPARRLERSAPAMALKGRIKEGADADLTVFDLATISDRATFQAPATFSEGVKYVLVNGTVVVDAGKVVDGVKPGRAMRRLR